MTVDEPEPIDVSFIEPNTIQITGPSLRIDKDSVETWVRSLPFSYPDDALGISELHLTAEDGLTITYLRNLKPLTLVTVHCPVVAG